MPYHDYYLFYPGSITRLMHILEENGIASREDLLTRFDVDATAEQYAGIKGIGPRLSELLVRLRGKSPDEWVKMTGTPTFNEPAATADQDWS